MKLKRSISNIPLCFFLMVGLSWEVGAYDAMQLSKLAQLGNCVACDLSGANLQGADLDDANLRKANLADANLEGAYLREANLSGAILFMARMWNINLSEANLSGAFLKGAVLDGARFCGTQFDWGEENSGC